MPGAASDHSNPDAGRNEELSDTASIQGSTPPVNVEEQPGITNLERMEHLLRELLSRTGISGANYRTDRPASRKLGKQSVKTSQAKELYRIKSGTDHSRARRVPKPRGSPNHQESGPDELNVKRFTDHLRGSTRTGASRSTPVDTQESGGNPCVGTTT